MKLIVACATDDDRTYTARHFGSAHYYALYELDESTCKFLQNLLNTSEKKETHADPQTARSMTC